MNLILAQSAELYSFITIYIEREIGPNAKKL